MQKGRVHKPSGRSARALRAIRRTHRQDDAEIGPGSYVVAKLVGHPFWPGIVGRCELSPWNKCWRTTSRIPGETYLVWVLFFNDYTADWVPRDLVFALTTKSIARCQVPRCHVAYGQLRGAVDEVRARMRAPRSLPRYEPHLDDLVLARFANFPLWPALVARAGEDDPCVERRGLWTADGWVFCLFLGDNDSNWIPKRNVCLYSPLRAQSERSPCTAKILFDKQGIAYELANLRMKTLRRRRSQNIQKENYKIGDEVPLPDDDGGDAYSIALEDACSLDSLQWSEKRTKVIQPGEDGPAADESIGAHRRVVDAAHTPDTAMPDEVRTRDDQAGEKAPAGEKSNVLLDTVEESRLPDDTAISDDTLFEPYGCKMAGAPAKESHSVHVSNERRTASQGNIDEDEAGTSHSISSTEPQRTGIEEVRPSTGVSIETILLDGPDLGPERDDYVNVSHPSRRSETEVGRSSYVGPLTRFDYGSMFLDDGD